MNVLLQTVGSSCYYGKKLNTLGFSQQEILLKKTNPENEGFIFKVLQSCNIALPESLGAFAIEAAEAEIS